MKVFDIIFTGLIPLVLLFAGWMMQFHPPKKQNVWIGYRTTRSMKNAETWRFANTYLNNSLIYLKTPNIHLFDDKLILNKFLTLK